MVGTIGVIFAVATFIWYYQLAEKAQKNSARWAIIGAAIYFFTRLVWIYGIFRPIIGAGVYDHSENLRFWGGMSAIVVAVALVVLVKSKFLQKTDEHPTP